MKKIGFIDFFIDEWHANNYPAWIKEQSGGKWETGYVWAKENPPGKLTTAEWAKKFGARVCSSPEEVIEKSDALIVLSPDNPEYHEELCLLPAQSKKPVYVDKTFAPDAGTARKIFSMFEKNQTPMFSSSALRFADEIKMLREKGAGPDTIQFLSTWGSGAFEKYIVHQFEMIVCLMGHEVKRLMNIGSGNAPSLVIEFKNGTRVQSALIPPVGFGMTVKFGSDQGMAFSAIKGDFFLHLISAMLLFFEDKKAPVPEQETLAIIAMIDAGKAALKKPDTWIKVFN